MLKQETAADIWKIYREIEAAKKILTDLDKARLADEDQYAERLKDAFGRKQHLQLGIPSGESGHRLLMVSADLGRSVVHAHIAKMEWALTEANEKAKIELNLKGGVTYENELE